MKSKEEKFKIKEDLFKKKHTEALLRVSTYLDMFPSFINQSIPDEKVLQQFDRVINKIRTSDQKSKYLKQLDKLKEKYL